MLCLLLKHACACVGTRGAWMRSRRLTRLVLPALVSRLHAAAPVMAADPRSICDRYTDDIYAKMRDDTERTAAYAAAIAEAAPGRVCLDLGTGGETHTARPNL